MRKSALLLGAAMLAVLPQPAAAKPPNIVVIMTDDQDDTGSLAIMPKTRELLAGKGVRFTNSFVNFPLCSPSRASFLSGLAAHNHGSTSAREFRERGLETASLGPWLQAAGYHTGFAGKYINGYDASYVPPGWHDWHGMAGGAYYNYTINANGTPEHYGDEAASYSTDVLTRKAEAFIDRQAGAPRPFFLLLTPRAPHAAGDLGAIPAPRHVGAYADLPFHPGRAFNEANVADKPAFVQAVPRLDDAEAARRAMIFRNGRESLLAVDDMVATVIAALVRARQLRNTFVVFTSDNGHLHGQHRLGGKHVVYEESIRVPLVIRGPDVPHRQRRTELVNNLDVVATIVALAGAAPTHALDGASLAPLFAAPASWRNALLVVGSDPTPGDEGAVGWFAAVRTHDHLWAEHHGKRGTPYGDEREFYDLTVDPRQLRSRPDDASYQEVIGNLRDLLATLRTCAGASCWH